MNLLLTTLFTFAVFASLLEDNQQLRKTNRALMTALRSLTSESAVGIGAQTRKEQQVGAGSANGYAHQIPCVRFDQPTESSLQVLLNQYIDDSGIEQETSETISIPAGFVGESCGSQINGKIYVNGYVGVSWEVTDESENTIAQFSTRSAFNGEGYDDDWNIDERGMCGAYSDYGVYLEYDGHRSCDELRHVDDSTVMKAVFVPGL